MSHEAIGGFFLEIDSFWKLPQLSKRTCDYCTGLPRPRRFVVLTDQLAILWICSIYILDELLVHVTICNSNGYAIWLGLVTSRTTRYLPSLKTMSVPTNEVRYILDKKIQDRVVQGQRDQGVHLALKYARPRSSLCVCVSGLRLLCVRLTFVPEIMLVCGAHKYIYTWIYIYVYICMYIYIYIWEDLAYLEDDLAYLVLDRREEVRQAP